MRPLLVATFAAIIALGCTYAQTKPITDENGETWLLVDCNRSQLCAQRAAETCPKGYVEKTGPGNAMMIRCK